MQKSICAVSAALMGVSFYSAPVQASDYVPNVHLVIINCDHKDIGSEETKNEVFVEWFKGSESLHKSSANKSTTATSLRFHTTNANRWTHENQEGPPKCDSNQVALYVYDGQNHKKKSNGKLDYGPRPTHFTITTTGSDGFFMDWVEYKDKADKDKNRRFGVSQNNGYCLSLDSSDATRTWKDNVEGCYESLKFKISNGKVTIAKR